MINTIIANEVKTQNFLHKIRWQVENETHSQYQNSYHYVNLLT